jgi:dimethylargininase
MLIAITRGVSPTIGDCELTFRSRQPIDVAIAMQQQRAYEACLVQLGLRLISLPAEKLLPDAVFVEDTAVVLDEIAVVATMGAVNRRGEVQSVANTLSGYRPLKFLNHSATLEGGDSIRAGRSLYIGVSKRTNREGINQLREHVKTYDYDVIPVEVKGCLHLTTGCTYIGRDTFLLNPNWVDSSPFAGVNTISIPSEEPWAANALLVYDTVILPASCPQTRLLLEERGFKTETLDVSELEKAEAGLTCMSLIFDVEEAD